MVILTNVVCNLFLSNSGIEFHYHTTDVPYHTTDVHYHTIDVPYNSIEVLISGQCGLLQKILVENCRFRFLFFLFASFEHLLSFHPNLVECFFVCLFHGLTPLSTIFQLYHGSFIAGGLGENHRLVASHWQTLSHMLYISPWSRFEFTSVVICTNYRGSCKSNYHAITATTTPLFDILNPISVCYKSLHSKKCC